jgi:hypothetical protein
VLPSGEGTTKSAEKPEKPEGSLASCRMGQLVISLETADSLNPGSWKASQHPLVGTNVSCDRGNCVPTSNFGAQRVEGLPLLLHLWYSALTS